MMAITTNNSIKVNAGKGRPGLRWIGVVFIDLRVLNSNRQTFPYGMRNWDVEEEIRGFLSALAIETLGQR